MKETRYYEVAGHRFCVSGEGDIFSLMGNYEPFAVNHGDRSLDMQLCCNHGPVPVIHRFVGTHSEYDKIDVSTI